jgi:hypothetical protein
MRDYWRYLLYVLLVGSLPLALWYAMWPHRRKLKGAEGPINGEDQLPESIIGSDG